MKKKKNIIICAVLVAVVVAVAGWTIWSNTSVALTEITLEEENLPYSFQGFRIAQVSDLHNSKLWEKTIARLEKADPDMIVITGDLVDAKNPDMELVMQFMAQAVQIADCFYISGNHEALLPEGMYDQLVKNMRQLGVMVLSDQRVKVHLNGSYITIAGHGWGNTDQIGSLMPQEGYSILLSHQPEGFEDYAAAGFDLVFSGHAHGGLVRIPLLGGIYAPGQGFFPKYDNGLYSRNNTDMIVSRGIGNSGNTIRFNNRPQVILVELQCG